MNENEQGAGQREEPSGMVSPSIVRIALQDNPAALEILRRIEEEGRGQKREEFVY